MTKERQPNGSTESKERVDVTEIGILSIEGDDNRYILLSTDFEGNLRSEFCEKDRANRVIKEQGSKAFLSFKNLDTENVRIVQMDLGHTSISLLDNSIGRPPEFVVNIYGTDTFTGERLRRPHAIHESVFSHLFIEPRGTDLMDFDEIKPKQGNIEFIILFRNPTEEGLDHATFYVLHTPAKTVNDGEKIYYTRSKATLSEFLKRLHRSISGVDLTQIPLQDDVETFINQELGRSIQFIEGENPNHILSKLDISILTNLLKLQAHFAARGSVLYPNRQYYNGTLKSLINYPKERSLFGFLRRNPNIYLGPNKWQEVLREELGEKDTKIPDVEEQYTGLRRLVELSLKDFESLTYREAFNYLGHYLNETITMFDGEILEKAGKKHVEKLFQRLKFIKQASDLCVKEYLAEISRVPGGFDDYVRISPDQNRIFTLDETSTTKLLPTSKGRFENYIEAVDRTYQSWASSVVGWRSSHGDSNIVWNYKRLQSKVGWREAYWREAEQILDGIKSMYSHQYKQNLPNYLEDKINAIALSQIILQLRILRYFEREYVSIKIRGYDKTRMKEWFFWLNKQVSNIVTQEDSLRSVERNKKQWLSVDE